MLRAQPCPTCYDPVDCHPPGSSVHGTSQARTLGGLPSLLRGSSRPRGRICVSRVSCTGRQLLHHQRHLGAQDVDRTLINDCWGSGREQTLSSPKFGHHARKIKPASRKLKKQWKHLNVNYFKQHILLRFE